MKYPATILSRSIPSGNHHLRLRLAVVGLAALLSPCPPTPGPPRNVKIATYNAAYLVPPKSSDGKFFDENGKPLTNKERAARMAERILSSDVEILALNEVFDEDSRDELVHRLRGVFPYFVAYIGNDSDPSDSGLAGSAPGPQAVREAGRGCGGGSRDRAEPGPHRSPG